MEKELKDEYIKREEFVINKKYKIIEKLIKIRKEKNMSQEQLCSKINMKQPSLARIEKGVVTPGIDTFLKILYPMGYTIEIKKIK